MRTPGIVCTGLFFIVVYLLTSIAAISVVDETLNDKNNFSFLVSQGLRDDRIANLGHYMVSIRTRAPRKYFGDNHFCSGAIIGSKKILTAAHCIMDKRKVLTRPRRMLLVAGTINRLQIVPSTIQMRVRKTIPHPSYILNNTHDIALIFLTEDLKFGDFIKQADLPDNQPPFQNEADCNVVGWGRMYPKGPLAAKLVAAKVELMSEQDCKAATPAYYDGIICAKSKGGLADPCRGDSGGPLVCNWTLTGVISWTIGCGNSKAPSLYVDVYHNKEWIEATNHVGQLMFPPLSFVALSLLILLTQIFLL